MRFSLLVLALLTSPAAADAQLHPMGNGGYCGTQDPEPGVYDPARVRAAPTTLFLNRCPGGCTITKGRHDAPNDVSNNPGTGAGPFTFQEFPSYEGVRGAGADQQWNDIVACVRTIYSYYNVNVVDTRPTSGPYHMSIVSGTNDSIQFQGQVMGQLLGLSALACSGPIDNVVSFALADNHRSVFQGAPRYVKEMCNTIVHEAGHAFGLEHEFEFDDGKSACPDPMSYDIGICNPPKHFFRNKSAKCGGVSLMPCACAMRQNSHAKLDAAFGSKTSEIANPTAVVTFSGSPPGTLGAVVAGNAGSERGVETLSLVMNGHVYVTQGGAPYVGELGQDLNAQYTISVPPGLPDSIYDLQFRACDDLDNCTDSAILTVTKGPAGGCTSTEACDTAQECIDGRCTFLPPHAEVGEECEVDEQCLSGVCRGSDTTKICTQQCNTEDDQCPDDLACQLPANETDPENGVCFFPEDGGGCCSTSDAPPWGAFALALGLAGWFTRRRRA